MSRLTDMLGRLQNNTDPQRGSQRGAAKLMRLRTKLLRFQQWRARFQWLLLSSIYLVTSAMA